MQSDRGGVGMYGRDIWFRGKCIKDGIWAYGDFIDNGNQCFIIPFNATKEHHAIFGQRYLKTENYVEVDPETIGQFTGMKDKNGTEIYGGDILTTDLDRPYLLVVFRNGANMFQCYDNGKFYYDHMAGVDEEVKTLDYTTVAGNVHDNPELLEVGEDNK